MGFDKRGGGENGGKGRFLLLFVFWILNVRTEWWWGGERGVRRTGICWALG